MIYLDHNAASPMRPEAIEAMRRGLGPFANPSSVHAAGRAARDLLDGARAEIARALGAAPGEVVLTSGATEAAALAIRGVLGAAQPGRRGLAVTAVEHPCVLDLGRALGREGLPLRLVAVDRRGLPDERALDEALSPETALVCAMLANNETGVLLPVGDIAAAAHRAGALVFCDAAQAAGKIPIDVRELGADLVALTGPKLGGPRGAGALWVRPGIRLAPLLGGHQQRGRRAGTEDVAGAAGLSAALSAALAGRAEEQPRLGALRDRLERGLLAAVPRARVNGAGAERLATTSSVAFEGCDGEALLMALDLAGLCASAGSACTSGSTKPSHVLSAMGLSAADAKATVRFSLGWSTTEQDVERALDIVPPLVEQVRRAIPSFSS